MSGAAILLDVVGAIAFLFNIVFGMGEILSWISDAIGMVFIGGWLFIRSGKIVSKSGKNFALATLGEVFPFLGVLPFWTLLVYSELKRSDAP